MAANDESPVLATVSGKDFLDKFEGLTSVLTQILVKIDPLPAASQDHEFRIRKVEALVWRASGAAAALGTAGGFIATYLSHR